MDDGIFENAEFGDKFLVRDGRKAVYHLKTEDNYCYIIDGTLAVISCDKNGSHYRDINSPCGLDIVSSCKKLKEDKLIDENRLDDLAYNYADSISNVLSICETLESAYKAGYLRRVSEEKWLKQS